MPSVADFLLFTGLMSKNYQEHDMKPVPLHSPWRARRHRLYAIIMLSVVTLLVTQPQTSTGVIIALSTMPLAWLLMVFNRWWTGRFARSVLMHAVYLCLLVLFMGAAYHTVLLLQPYVGMHFS